MKADQEYAQLLASVGEQVPRKGRPAKGGSRPSQVRHVRFPHKLDVAIQDFALSNGLPFGRALQVIAARALLKGRA